MSLPLNPKDLVGKFTLIIGEVNSGKTRLTESLVTAYTREIPERIVVLDLAPDVRDRLGENGTLHRVGGRILLPPIPNLRIHRVPIVPPRLTTSSPMEQRRLAAENARRIEAFLDMALADPPPCLVVNDVSLYLQHASPYRLLERMNRVPTRIVNGYFGILLGDDPFSKRERTAMLALMIHCDHLLWLEKSSKET